MAPTAPAAKTTPDYPRETDLALGIRFGSLLLLGIAGLVIFYGALVATAQVIAVGSGARGADLAAVAMWVTSVVIVLGALPIVRFVADEVPLIVDRYMRSTTDYKGTLVLLVLAGLALMWL